MSTVADIPNTRKNRIKWAPISAAIDMVAVFSYCDYLIKKWAQYSNCDLK